MILVKKVKSQLCAWTTSAAVCAEGFWVNKKICSCVRRDLQLSAQLEELKRSAAECADQNCGFCKELNKTQFCGRSPYTRGHEPHYIWCCGSFVVSVIFFYALINIYLINKITANIITSL